MCDPLPSDVGIISSTEYRTEVYFSCQAGTSNPYTGHGSVQSQCTAVGRWSHNISKCQGMWCILFYNDGVVHFCAIVMDLCTEK